MPPICKLVVAGDLDVGRLLRNGDVDPEPFQALVHLIHKAHSEAADAVLLLGNMFAMPAPPAEVMERLCQRLAASDCRRFLQGSDGARLFVQGHLVPSRLLVLDGAQDGSSSGCQHGALGWLAGLDLITRVGGTLGEPVQMVKTDVDVNTTAVALYAAGHDPELHTKLASVKWKVPPEIDDNVSWFNLGAFHQKRKLTSTRLDAPAGGLVSSELLPQLLDITLWGGPWSMLSRAAEVDDDGNARSLMDDISYDERYYGDEVYCLSIHPGRATFGAQVIDHNLRRTAESSRALPAALLLHIMGDNWKADAIPLGSLVDETGFFPRNLVVSDAAIGAPFVGGLLRTSGNAGAHAGVELREDEMHLVLLAVGYSFDLPTLGSLALVSRRISSMVNRVLLELLMLPASELEPRRTGMRQVLRIVTAWPTATLRRDADLALLNSMLENAHITAGVRGFAACARPVFAVR